MLSGKKARGRAFGRQIAFNVIPQVDALEADGSYRAKSGALWEECRECWTCRLLRSMRRRCGYRCSSAIAWQWHASFERHLGAAEAEAVLQRGRGLSVIEAGSDHGIPTPATLAMAPDKVYVGRLRRI